MELKATEGLELLSSGKLPASLAYLGFGNEEVSCAVKISWLGEAPDAEIGQAASHWDQDDEEEDIISEGDLDEPLLGGGGGLRKSGKRLLKRPLSKFVVYAR